MNMFKRVIGTLITVFAFQSLAVEPVKDNSFLLEEAYNQEPGVVQFIQGYQYLDPSKDWGYTFTTEMPIKDETHQFSFVVPVLEKSEGPGKDKSQVGDILLNYRYQLLNTELLTMAPRLSLILPTGDYKKEFGSGVLGLQFNQAVSIAVNERWTNHWNAGFTYLPSAKNMNGDTANLFGFNFGTSAIYNYTPKFNFLCEFVYNSSESVTGPDSKEASSSYYIIPGVRGAFDVGEETEVVPGLGVLLGLGPSAEEHETGVFLYLSIESKLW